MGEALPSEDVAAHTIAQKLGFTLRGEEDYGTSILIIGTKVSIESLKEGIETSWWLRLIDTELTGF